MELRLTHHPGLLALLLMAVFTLAPAGAAAASERSCVERARQALKSTQLRLVRGEGTAACGRVNGDRRRDVAAVVRSRGHRVSRWAVVVKRSAGWRLVKRGRRWGPRPRKGRLSVSIAPRTVRVKLTGARQRAAGGCTRVPIRRRTWRWRGRGLRRVRSTLRFARQCPAPALPPSLAPPLSCRNNDPAAADIGVSTRGDLPPETPGLVLPGTWLQSQAPPHGADYVDGPGLPHYPGGELPTGSPRWRGLEAVPLDRQVYAASAHAFNGDEAAYRVAHDLAYFGLSPISVGDIDGDGIDDLAQTVHWAAVDGKVKVGQVHIYLGRRAPAELDPRRDVPDIIFYGEEEHGRLGIEVAPAGDVNADGVDDLLMSAAFTTTFPAAGGIHRDGGSAYVVLGGNLHRYRCPTKVRVGDIGTKVDGVVLEGGHDDTRRLGWTNTLDSGDLDGDGDSELILGAYDPNRPFAYTPFRSRAYVLNGGPGFPRRGRFRLGVDDPGLDETVIEMPEPEWTLGSTMFQTSAIGDLDRDGDEELAIGAGGASAGRGSIFIFPGRPGGLPRTVVPVQDAELVIEGDQSADDAIEVRGLSGARPAGDVDGDGYDDAQLSARWARVDGRTVGAVGVLRGGPSLPGGIGFLELDGIVVGDGPDVESIGMPGMNTGTDLTGDGLADLLINDPYWREEIGGELQPRGRLWLVRGEAALPPLRTIQEAADHHFLPDNRYPGLFGYQWNTGDWNGDARPDIVVADHYLGDSGRRDHPGASYLFMNGRHFGAG